MIAPRSNVYKLQAKGVLETQKDKMADFMSCKTLKAFEVGIHSFM